jgi:hypothetical protein
MEAYQSSSNVLFILLGAIMVLAMHAGFAFLEVGTVRKKNQVNALVKILTDFGVSTLAYFFIGYSIAYGVNFFTGVDTLLEKNGFELTKFFFLLTFAAAIPAIIYRRARPLPATDGDLPDRRFHLPLRRHCGTRPWRPGLAEGQLRRRVPRLCRFGGGACHGRLDRAARRAAARRSPRALHP